MINKRHLIAALLLASLIFNLVALVHCRTQQNIINESAILAETTLEQLNTANKITDQYAAKVHELEDRVEELKKLNDTFAETLTMHQDSFVVESPAPPRYIDCGLNEDLQDYIWVLCSYYGISDKYELIYAMMKQESRFTVDIISKTGDYGLMQINSGNHKFLRKTLGIDDFLNPYQNVHAGIYMIAGLLHKYDVSDALMAYNMGEGGAAGLWRAGIHSTYYSKQILDYYAEFTGNI